MSARFTLDAMPGKQMAIDADLNAGLIDQEEAKKRRQDVTQEADFYGSMDGASKFVKGDAIAGIMILFINIIGGFIIGMMQHQLSFGEAAQSTPCSPWVTAWWPRSRPCCSPSPPPSSSPVKNTDQDMGTAVLGQLFENPKALVISAGIPADDGQRARHAPPGLPEPGGGGGGRSLVAVAPGETEQGQGGER